MKIETEKVIEFLRNSDKNEKFNPNSMNDCLIARYLKANEVEFLKVTFFVVEHWLGAATIPKELGMFIRELVCYTKDITGLFEITFGEALKMWENRDEN